MTSSRNLRFTPEARTDLSAIQRYTRRSWGETRRAAYADRLFAASNELTVYPNLGRARDDVSPGLRGLPVREHVVFYRLAAGSVIIARILHQRIDATGQFDADH